MNFLFMSVILPGILWDCIKVGSKFSSKILEKKLKNWSIEEENLKLLKNVLKELEQRNITSKKELKKELRTNENFKLFNTKIIIKRNIHKNTYINFFGIQNINENDRKITKKKKERCQKKSKRKNKLIRCSILMFILSIIAINLFSFISKNKSDKYWKGEKSSSSNYGGGTGTANDPYLINLPCELAELSYLVENGIDYKNTYFKLNKDLYLNNINDRGFVDVPNSNMTITNINLNTWIPIGSKEHPFCGYFDGNHKSIHGLYINDNNRSYQGLFGYCTSESKITNLTIEKSIINVTSGNFVGGICGKMDGLLDGCFSVRGWVYGGFCVGGIAGEGNVVVNCGSSAFIEDTNNSNKSNSEININSEVLSNKGCLGGIVGKCNYLVNSVSYSRLINPTYRAGALAGEVVFDIFNCVCSDTMIHYDYFNKYFKFLNENNMAFLYGDVLGIFDGQSDNTIENHCIYATESCSGIYTTASDNNKEQFRLSYPHIYIDNFEDIYSSNNYFAIMNHDYSVITELYNTITEEIDYHNHESVIEKLNDNIDTKTGALFHSDIENILKQYGVGGGILNLKKWVHSNQHNLPTLDGMNLEYIIYMSR
ncbi:MAG: hypothetical protein HFJ09_01825 [Lachnospiraceae bacterium]|nr:hypothetical protein [Lachnospiraceae bacterium]